MLTFPWIYFFSRSHFNSYKAKGKPGPEVVWRVESHPGEDAKVPSTFQNAAGQPVTTANQAPGTQGTGDIQQTDLPAAVGKHGKKPSKLGKKKGKGHRRHHHKKHAVTGTKVCAVFYLETFKLFVDIFSDCLL